MTDSSANLVSDRNYDPYGQVAVNSESVTPDFGYAGYYLHVRSGLNLTLYRAYDSNLSRWLNRDPIYESNGSPYMYVNNAPIAAIDSLGLAPTNSSQQFGKLGSQMISFCDCKCLDKPRQAQCRVDAIRVALELARKWNDNFGKGTRNGTDLVGGYYCWDWASAWVNAVNLVDSEIWGADLRYFTGPGKGRKQAVHFGARILIKDARDPNHCQITLDDGFIKDPLSPGMVHGPGWPHSPIWLEQGVAPRVEAPF
jgi:RHS repeat-associated protein